MFKKCARSIISILLVFSLSVQANELLKTSDVHKVMEQLFIRHVDKKEMSTAILKNALKTYVDQFDPNRIYLLENETRPFLNPTDEEMNRILRQYQLNDLSIYIQLNELIQKAIFRSRKLREEIEKNNSSLYKNSLAIKPKDNDEHRDADSRRYFAKNEYELKNRIQSNIMEFILYDTKKFGASAVEKDVPKTIKRYENIIRNDEEEYLTVDDSGHPIPQAAQENLFVLHVLKSLASSLDAHTKFLDSREAYNMKVRLEKEYNGIGIVVRKLGNDVVVSSLIQGSSAEKNGVVKVNDRIVSINGLDISTMPLDKIQELISRDNIKEAALVLSRKLDNVKPEDEQIKVTLKRETIPINEGRVETSTEPFDNGIIGTITLHMFYQGNNGVASENDVREAIQTLQKKGNLKGLVFDLRDNSGGFLLQAVKVAGLFISSGVIVISKYSSGDEKFYRDIDNKTLYDGPLVVLTSRATASAAEIVAQALQDYGVALVVGDEQTYGKGTIQSQTVTEDGASSFFKVTVGKYYTVSGKTPQLQGVKADIIVPSRYQNVAFGEEYLEDTITPDKIPPSYKDPLSDLDVAIKPWYLRFYTSQMQQKLQTWRNMLPALRDRSADRISHNKAYQKLLSRPANIDEDADDSKQNFKGPWLFPIDSKSNTGEDLQMTEAVNIVKDMILMQRR